MTSTLHKFVLVLACVSVFSSGYAQQGRLKKFFRLTSPERRWVYAHPFITIKTLKLSEHAAEITREQERSPDLDGYGNGGQVDAFRHCFWMASLCQEIKEKKALKLGIAHEKGNEKDFKKRQYEEGVLPDMIANTMDLCNNQIGAVLSRENPGVNEETLIFLVKAAITSGRCKIIKRDSNGDFLDADGKIVKYEDWHGQWVNARCLVSSDHKVY